METKLSTALAKVPVQSDHENAQGNRTQRWCGGSIEDRYYFDFGLCKSEYGWKQYDTNQDASYYGIWVHIEAMQVFSYIEGDLELVTCTSIEDFQVELGAMAEFHGDPPPAFKSIDVETGQVTHYFDERPRVET